MVFTHVKTFPVNSALAEFAAQFSALYASVVMRYCRAFFFVVVRLCFRKLCCLVIVNELFQSIDRQFCGVVSVQQEIQVSPDDSVAVEVKPVESVCVLKHFHRTLASCQVKDVFDMMCFPFSFKKATAVGPGLL